jgi:hypothetical protein
MENAMATRRSCRAVLAGAASMITMIAYAALGATSWFLRLLGSPAFEGSEAGLSSAAAPSTARWAAGGALQQKSPGIAEAQVVYCPQSLPFALSDGNGYCGPR